MADLVGLDDRTGAPRSAGVGALEGKHGVFLGDDVVGGRPVKVRFDWHGFDADTAQWEQAFSFDGGGTWVHNWRMCFTRIVR